MSNQMLANIAESLKNGGPYVFGWAKLMLMQQLSVVHLTVNSLEQLEQINQILSRVVCSTVNLSLIDHQPLMKCKETNSGNIKICIGKSCYPTSEDPDYYISLINSIKL